MLALVLMIAATGIVARQISVFLLVLPIYIFLIGLFAVGIGWIVASLHVFVRDTAQVLSVILTFWFWLTPIMLTENQVPQRFRFLMTLNPMYYGVRAYRGVLLTVQRPHLHDGGMLALASVAAFVIGGFFFRYMKRGFADVL